MQKHHKLLKGKPPKCLYSENVKSHSKEKTKSQIQECRQLTAQQTKMNSEHKAASL